ncbi:ABC transporter permease [Vallitalea guaymasensis]|uniref:ABC transporter permease n=1 Tax=Vallitalea guaymasensis TaxID=1185412 RepID=UPI000DE39F6C|nr:ABC transporter permease subunit [Vallitalea guaymasensis]
MKSIILKEAKIKMRSWKSVGMIVSYVALLAFGVIVMLSSTLYSVYNNNLSENYRNIYMTITIIQVLMISFIVPIIASGSISQEREKQTLDILLSTNMRPISIIMGKLMTTVSVVILLIVTSLPIFSFIFLFGGLNITSILSMVAFFIIISFFFGSLGVFFSTLFKKTLTSIVLTFLVMMFLTIGTILIPVIYTYMTRDYSYFENNTFFLYYINPGITFWAVLLQQFGGIDRLTGYLNGVTLNDNITIISCCLYVLLSVGLNFASAYILNPIKKKKGIEEVSYD